MRDWYPTRKPFSMHRLQVDDIHSIYIEECGKPDGVPVLWCHGGPGGGLQPVHGRQFDPERYRVILFSQRGAPQSLPFAEIRKNTTQHLLADMELIRKHLSIPNWIVAGRSWGTTLALLYAQANPKVVKGLFLAAVFLCDEKSIHWLFRDGASRIYPEAWARFCAPIPPDERADLLSAYARRLTGKDEAIALRCAAAWADWEAHTLSLRPDPAVVETATGLDVCLSLARLEAHYLSQGGFIDENQILRDASKIAHIPTHIVHGRYDMNTTYSNAVLLHQALGLSELLCVPLGGHATNDPVTVDAQIQAADALITSSTHQKMSLRS